MAIDFFKYHFGGKKIFITGHTGFKGTWLLQTLKLFGAEITGFALLPMRSNDIFNLISGSDLCKSIIGDIRNKEEVQKALVESEPDFIFHLAAQPLVRYSYEFPLETFETNVSGTANVLHAARFLKKKCHIVVVTTDKVYYNDETGRAYSENDRLGGYDPYSSSKACAELVVACMRDSFFSTETYSDHGIAIAVGRVGNVIGGGDWNVDRLFPDIIRALISHKEIVIRNPESIRPWQHVLESVYAYLLLAIRLQENPKINSTAFNFGPDLSDDVTVERIVKIAISFWDAGDPKVQKAASSVHETDVLRLDNSKAKQLLNWTPKLNITEAVQYTMDWYRTLEMNKEDIIKITHQQINQFFT